MVQESVVVDKVLLAWLNDHPEVVMELRKRSGLD